MKSLRIKYYLGFLFSILVLASSCNKDFDTVIPGAPENEDNVNYKERKVLYLIVDGARGSSVRDGVAPNIKSLIGNSIYSWTSLSDTSKNNATNWADMLTGVKKEKHGVLSDNFAANNLEEYPVFFQHIKDINPDFRVASFATSSLFKERLTGGTVVSELLANDAALTTKMVDYLKTETADIVLGQFSDVQKAGDAFGYDNKFAQYKTAITNFDTQVGEILTTLKSRATYNKENWLIIVTSSRGGQYQLPASEDDKTLFSNTNANTFTIFHNPEYKQVFIGRPFLGSTYAGSAITFRGDPQNVKAVTSGSVSQEFNFGQDDFTISIKIKKGKSKNTSRGDYFYQWPSVLGKRTNSGWGNSVGPGWDFSLFYNGWRFLGGGGADPNGREIGGLDFSGDTWHDLTFVMETKADGFRYSRLYTDGVMGITNHGGSPSNPRTTEYKWVDGYPNFDNNEPLRVGYAPGEIDGDLGNINVQLAELKIWKGALSEAVIKQYSCDPTMDESHPNYDLLMGYWPMVEGSGNILKDLGPFEANLTLSGDYKWDNFTSLICSPSNSNLGTLVPKNSDIPAQILGWFNIAREEAWGLDGRVWVPN